ncbi:ribonuclease HI [Rickettsia endosymbiont of Oedothorax gibbosus]|uniref:ribonuclease HI n=1 Tax=Rickettsia endosymbiont of Oedothorax gibbosus TaxID=931099 RepID=UPI0020255FD1|nr:ribonuclease HI [Rickettsia endosymbiont of Oedothorax gibbosus]
MSTIPFCKTNLQAILQNSLSIPKVVIYTDGACSGNPGPGGWGALLQFNGVCKEIFGHELHTTNNRMEMTAAIEALKVLKKSCCVELYTDSKYLQLGITQWINTWIKNNWHKNNNDPIKNVDLWKKLYDELGKHSIIWNWVKGHGNNKGNQIADSLAVKGKETAIKMLKCHS